MKILTVVGARPQFIKASAISRVIRTQHGHRIQEVMVHTGQHFDANMSDVFFEQLQMSPPKYCLNIGGLSHAAMTARMMEALEDVMLTEHPDLLLVYGDTNSTLAAALTAVKLHVPIAHIEAGLRSFNRAMPEEINRVLTDTLATYLFCPTKTAVANLAGEGIHRHVYEVGDVMYDLALQLGMAQQSDILKILNIEAQDYVLVTCHREANTNTYDNLSNIVLALQQIAQKKTVIFPVHPRTLKYLKMFQLQDELKNVRLLEPVSYLDLLALQRSAYCILTDSGGMQKEAFFYQVPCITMREETEWVETVALGWNRLVGSSMDKILHAYEHLSLGSLVEQPYGDGRASEHILEYLCREYQL